MNPRITPEIRTALQQHPVGPVRMEGNDGESPVFLVRLDDIASLQELVDGRIQDALSAADQDIADGKVMEWDADAIKQRGRNLQKPFDSE